MPRSVKKLRLKWLRPPLFPLIYLLCIALPLAIWQSPGTDPQATAVLVVSLGLLILVAATARSARLAWARIYFAAGAGMALFHAHFQANELAGIMLLFAPLAAVLASPWRGVDGTSPRRADGKLSPALPPVHRLQCGLLALLFGGTLFATGSRGGILALLAATGVALILERRWRLLLVGLGLAVTLATSTSFDWLIHDGKAQGLSVDSLFTGRPEIWRRSLHAVADFSWTGIGVGTYSEVVPALYYPAGSGSLEDAHSLVLQTALDLGVVGLLAMATIVWLAFRQIWSTWRRAGVATGATRVRAHAWAFGLFTSLLAFVLFNLFDAVALGSPGSVLFFILLGLIYALPRPRPRWRRSRVRYARFWPGPPRGRRRLLVGAIFMVLGLSSIRGARQLGAAAVLGARAIVRDSSLLPAAHAALGANRRSTCRAGWLEGKVAQAWDRPRLRDDAWADLLRCSAAFVPLIADELPDGRHLAEQAVEFQPSSAAAHLWLARIRLSSQDREAAERLYRRSLELDPGNGVAWLELGRLLAPGDPQAALDAFKQGCHHGDPGANACLAAGATAEQLGDLETALRCYLKSRLPAARERAERLRDMD